MSPHEKPIDPPTEMVTTSGVKVVVRPTSAPKPVARKAPPRFEPAPRVVVRPPPNPHAARDAAVRRIFEQDGLFLLGLLGRARHSVTPASAEEMRQELFIVVTKYIDDTGAPPDNDRGYLTEIARRILWNRDRAFRVRVDPEADTDAAADSAPDAEEVLDLARRRVRLHAAIASLPDVLQPVVRGIDLDGDTIDRTAARLGRPRGTVSSQLTRARALLAGILGEPVEGGP
jgi:RNA polymerase sigma-70 factor (ECF subfamily)